ncbi:ubiquinone/menaquinone biosynthesis C-methylase UbiE [Paenibacillus forsythiae]|uniref:Ubiquinone/menaquinone biosynthesis C-methylase UbiE n=1 Tax=Paenibacillus forsythiae TaxID=365616 RepID=A0ABU3H571_9BACL|nr:methyltransferase domain-containing protein [Paenibacillus forsythiae]MDT3425962.1 ubiquinone/menaquinone biosynthesis C-methylase UbiE [Paenibacillus forsythiae]
MESVIRYYDGYDEASRLTRDNVGKLEFITTTHLLNKYISAEHTLLDLGAGTGIYSFYYLKEQADQSQCISECMRVLKPGGILAVAYVNKFFIFPYLVKWDTRFLTNQWMAKFLEEGSISSADEDCFWTDAYFHTPAQIEQLLGEHGADKLEHAAADGIGVIMRDTVNTFGGEQFDSWVQYHLRTCSEPSILGISNHGLYVGRK